MGQGFMIRATVSVANRVRSGSNPLLPLRLRLGLGLEGFFLLLEPLMTKGDRRIVFEPLMATGIEPERMFLF